jgi:hypothetical protein
MSCTERRLIAPFIESDLKNQAALRTASIDSNPTSPNPGSTAKPPAQRTKAPGGVLAELDEVQGEHL